MIFVGNVHFIIATYTFQIYVYIPTQYARLRNLVFAAFNGALSLLLLLLS